MSPLAHRSDGTDGTYPAQGGEDTFGNGYKFTDDLRSAIERDLPKINVKVLVYPKYETRGDLGNCVSRFRDW